MKDKIGISCSVLYANEEHPRDNVKNYLNERKIMKKVKKHYRNHKYLIPRLQTKLNAIECSVTLEVLKDMEPEAIVREIFEERTLYDMQIIQ